MSSSVYEKSDLTLTSSVPALTLGVPPNIECNKNVDDDNKEDNSNDSERDKDKTVIGLNWGDDPLENEKRPHINTAHESMGWFTGSQYVAPQKMAGFWSALRSLGDSRGPTLHLLEVACLIHLSRSAFVLRIILFIAAIRVHLG